MFAEVNRANIGGLSEKVKALAWGSAGQLRKNTEHLLYGLLSLCHEASGSGYAFKL